MKIQKDILSSMQLRQITYNPVLAYAKLTNTTGIYIKTNIFY